MMYEDIKDKTLKLLKYIEEEDYLGYDPYDFYLSPYAKYLPKSIYFLHLQKIAPFNLRRILKIKKGMVTKVYALTIDSYLNLYNTFKDDIYLEKAQALFSRMMSAAVVKTSEEIGWGRNYPFKTGGEIHDNKKPLVYLNSRLGQTMIKMFDVTHDKNILEDLEKVIRNLLRTGRVLKKGTHTFIGYSPDKNTRLTFNVSMVATELIMQFLDRSDRWDCEIDGYNLETLSYEIIKSTIELQENDGGWIYGYSAKGQPFDQKDFHQGFVIDALYNVYPLIRDKELAKETKSCYEKGYEYMIKYQINDEGEFYWRYPKKYPLDIHNHAQGILSLTLNEDRNSNTKLYSILNNVFENFWNDKKNCFYYQKWQFFTNKISYIRWCNCWMLYALTSFLYKNK